MKQLQEYAANYGIQLTDEMAQSFALYADMLVDWNSRVNLTAITQPDEICVKHFLDSLVVLQKVDIPMEASLVDVGTGAGFPGVPLRIARPDLQLTLLDSLKKRVRFLEELSVVLHQDNLVFHGRAEESARLPRFREQYDVATARAVAALPALCEYCLPFVKVGGIFVALKGHEVEEEIVSASNALGLLGGKVEQLHKLELPLDNKRALVVIRKISQTTTKYPRAAVKITKSPM